MGTQVEFWKKWYFFLFNRTLRVTHISTPKQCSEGRRNEPGDLLKFPNAMFVSPDLVDQKKPQVWPPSLPLWNVVKCRQLHFLSNEGCCSAWVKMRKTKIYSGSFPPVPGKWRTRDWSSALQLGWCTHCGLGNSLPLDLLEWVTVPPAWGGYFLCGVPQVP